MELFRVKTVRLHRALRLWRLAGGLLKFLFIFWSMVSGGRSPETFFFFLSESM